MRQCRVLHLSIPLGRAAARLKMFRRRLCHRSLSTQWSCGTSGSVRRAASRVERLRRNSVIHSECMRHADALIRREVRQSEPKVFAAVLRTVVAGHRACAHVCQRTIVAVRICAGRSVAYFRRMVITRSALATQSISSGFFSTASIIARSCALFFLSRFCRLSMSSSLRLSVLSILS